MWLELQYPETKTMSASGKQNAVEQYILVSSTLIVVIVDRFLQNNRLKDFNQDIFKNIHLIIL